jgi:CIC family chloride channel protein
MATFYGGLAHVPIGSLVMTCELAGSYDLLVPLMLAEGIAFVALRHRSLYHAQVGTKRDSAAHRDDLIFDILKGVRVADIVVRGRQWVAFERNAPAAEVIQRIARSEEQDAFPVLGTDGSLVGVISADVLRTFAAEPHVSTFALADDMMSPPLFALERDELNVALERMLINSVRELIVTNESGHVIGLLDEAEITAVYLSATGKAQRRSVASPSQP